MKHKATKITLIIALSVLEVIQLTAIVLFFRLAFVRITPFPTRMELEHITMTMMYFGELKDYEMELKYDNSFFWKVMQDFKVIAPYNSRKELKPEDLTAVFHFEDENGGKHTFYIASLKNRDFFGLKLSVVNCDGKYYYAERQFCEAMDLHYEPYKKRYLDKLRRMAEDQAKESPPETAE